uniref:Cell migration inducing hyaluronidase 1 n=1 Tax=Neogobius melanostomus TaxID=47308 RepID=A0A8C6T4R3_9GOBI
FVAPSQQQSDTETGRPKKTIASNSCPDKEPGLQTWLPGHSEDHRVTIGRGQKVLLRASATVHSLEIQSGGKLVIADTHRPILLRTRHILIGAGGEVHVGSPDCPYRGNLTISLYGRSDDPDTEHSYFGQKYIGVGTGGTLEIHGAPKLSWTFLNRTLLPDRPTATRATCSRGRDTANFIGIRHRQETVVTLGNYQNESVRLADFLDAVDPGLVLVMVVNDEASNNLEDTARNSLSQLGSRHIRTLAMFSGTKASSEAHVSHTFRSREGLSLSITASSQWVQGSNSSIVELAEPPQGWGPGDRIVVASTDYSMHQAEEFTLLPCPGCSATQIRVAGTAQFLHVGELVDGVDMRAEVGLLTRNILLRGEMQEKCYGHHACKFFSFDTFGGHLKVERGFKAAHVSGVELHHMGQQSMGHYPIHFHMNGDVDEKGGYHPPTSIQNVSIHHSFSRCVTIHGSNGLLVKDVVGYDILGHCYFTEDGPEERNTFDHCLGLVVRAGTLLPSDRDGKMCRDITSDAYPGYVANPRQDCSATSTFWIANPNNNLVNCSAAGSEETGFWFIFHHVPTGPSEGMYTPGHTEHTPMGLFINNRAHSNNRAGMILDNGVKTTKANNKDKKPYLSLVASRYGPHQDADPFKPRVPARIHRFIAYKNMDQGAWLRGGDVWLDECQFADNAISLTLASGGTFPDDDGSHQQVVNSVFVGESDNRGTFQPGQVWGPGGIDLKGRSLPRAVNFPTRGMQVYDGPVRVHNCTFRKFSALEGRHTSAIGFRLNNSWQTCPNNNVSQLTFDQVPVSVGPFFSLMQRDGDKTALLHDTDGSLSQYPGAYLVKEDNWLLRHPDCIDVPEWRGAICSGNYAQVYIQIRNPASPVMQIVRDEYPDRPLTLEGAVAKKKHYQQFQPVVTLYKGYTVHWDQAAPAEVTIWIINFNKDDWINVGLCYPRGTTFTILSDLHDRATKVTRKTATYAPTNNRDKLQHPHPNRSYYYWEQQTGSGPTLHYYVANASRSLQSSQTQPPSNCMSQAYPQHAELPPGGGAHAPQTARQQRGTATRTQTTVTLLAVNICRRCSIV